MYRTLARYCAPLLLVLAIGCAEDSPTGPPIVIPGDNEAIVYSKHIQPIFTNTCGTAGCHLGSDEGGGLNVSSWEKVMAGSKNTGAVVVPYAGARSYLFQHINTDTTLGPIAEPHMPLGRDPLAIEQIRTIKRWIDEGAKNDAGEVALAGLDRPRVLVTGQNEDLVAAIDLQTNLVMRFIDVGALRGGPVESPHNIIFSPDRKYFYVNMIAAGLVEKYDTRTFEKLGSARVGSAPAQIAITRDGSTLYVSNFDVTLSQLFINRVNASTMTVTDTIHDVGRAPHGVTLSADEKYLYTTNALGDDISEIDLASKEVTRRFLVSPNFPLPTGMVARFEPYQGELGPDGTTFWVSCRTSDEVRVFDLVAGRVIDSIKVGSRAGSRPLIPKFTPDKKEFWVPNRSTDEISIIDAASRRVTHTITQLKNQPHAVEFTRDGSTAYVTCENITGDSHHGSGGKGFIPGIVYVIDVKSRTILKKIEVAAFAAGLVVGG